MKKPIVLLLIPALMSAFLMPVMAAGEAAAVNEPLLKTH